MIRKILISLFMLVTMAAAARAQDGHYWTYPYGTRAQLLGGVVIGSVVDISATYYNPGALSLLSEPDKVAASTVMELASTTVEAGGSEATLDVGSTNFGEAPGFFGGQFPIFKSVGSFGYSVFTRYRYQARKEQALVVSNEPLPGGTEPVDLTAQFKGEQNLNETWVGLTLSRRISGRTSLGVTQYAALRSQRGGGLADARAILPDSSSALSSIDQSYSYWNARLLWKAGFSFSWQRITFGFTLTTASIDLLGSGSFWFNRTIFGQDLDGDGTDDPRMASTLQEDLEANWKSSWALGGGATYAVGPTRLHLSVEGFSKVDQFTVMQVEPFESQEPEEQVQVAITSGSKSVINYGLGVEHTFSPTSSGFASFRTDFSAVDPEADRVITSTTWNLFFLTAGGSLKIGASEITLGGSLGFGNDTRERLIELIPEEQRDLLSDLDSETKLSYRSLRFIISLAL